MVVVDGVVMGPTSCDAQKVAGTEACEAHKEMWNKHKSNYSSASLSGLKRALQCRNENLAWLPNSYFSPNRYYCVETVCAPFLKNILYRPWLLNSRFVVDGYHYTNHKADDDLCCTFCNPAPSDGSAPNLVIIEHDWNGQPYYKRAFNTQACEQLNSWLGGFESILKRMTVSNFNWFLHAMLVYHTQHILDRQQQRAMKTRLSDDLPVDMGVDI
ncbi:hypothetical protein BDQ17DRAFT_1392303 [Cyathus striatus]|nr:hypothetical protein BDQ17DRAFT_1392303 [Cyathus striatus]